ncbi:ABC transporter substrate-binding protein [Chelatococcus reniformis]|uniref:Branched-chain amino acid ABC transporter substrate-binding protein n=1 Tax=Chelatococcus reniformis TaxID=1494448 RepID=A0A916UJP3_9HYPH|nr:ABC transporter substrate-binding protein [Chelatococcus reniformis]GGC75463.1 branched-chain amino acid ABC transporter substrate-binding protein [Chelatococcus reniformis]
MRTLKFALLCAAGLGATLGPAWAQKQYDTGATDTAVTIGNTVPYSGPLSAHGMQGRTEAAFFRMLNEERGGINGRKINFISLDDAFSPPKTVEQTRKLVEQDGVLATFASVGTAAQTAVQKYLNGKGVPQLLVSTGATKWNQPSVFKWTTPASSTYGVEAESYAKYLLKEKPDAKVVIFYQNDDYGKDYVTGFKKGLGDKASTMIIKEITYELTDPTVDSQVLAAKNSGADTLLNVTLGKATSQTFKKLTEIGWKPLQFVSSPSTGRVFLDAAGIENIQGIMTASAYKQVTSPRWADDPDVKTYLAFMKKYLPNDDITNEIGFVSYSFAHVMAHIIEKAGDNLTRENLLKQATTLKDVKVPALIPGVSYSNSPTDYTPVKALQLYRFEGNDWAPVGEVIHIN